jgi:glycosyltransferase involved in cell wall biosynthesis
MVEFQQLGIQCHSLGLSRLKSAFVGITILRRFIGSHQVDVVHSSGVRADILSACVTGDWIRVSTRRPPLFEYRVIPHGPLLGTIIDAAEIWALSRMDQVVFVSNDAQQKARDRVGLRGIVIPNGVDQDTFSTVNAVSKKNIRRNLGLPQNSQIFVSINHLTNGKDPFTVLHGFIASIVAKEGILVLLGDGSLRKKCEVFCRRHSNIKIIGYTNEVREYLQAADFFISASLSEGFPNTVLEALACGLPVILSDIGPHREALSFDPRAGKLFQVKRSVSLTTTLNELVHEDYAVQSSAALGIVNNYLNARNMSIQYQEIYMDCIRNFTSGQRDQ